MNNPDSLNVIELIKTADVLIESFRPSVMDRLGLGYGELKKHNSKLIYCAITGYGQKGPYSRLPGHDVNYLSYAGLLGLQGEQNGKPTNSPVQIADIGGGALMAAIGILVSIIEAKKSGKGQFVDISMLDGTISWMQTILPSYLATKELPEKGGMLLTGKLACYENYETKDKRFLAVGAIEDKFWKNFCKVIGREDLISKLNAPNEEQKVIKKEIQAIINRRNAILGFLSFTMLHNECHSENRKLKFGNGSLTLKLHEYGNRKILNENEFIFK